MELILQLGAIKDFILFYVILLLSTYTEAEKPTNESFCRISLLEHHIKRECECCLQRKHEHQHVLSVTGRL